jgi:hypothetical protein
MIMRNRLKMKTANFGLLLMVALSISHCMGPIRRGIDTGSEKRSEGHVLELHEDQDSKMLTAGFEAKYPFVKVEIFRAGGEQIVNRAIAEQVAGNATYDVGQRICAQGPSEAGNAPALCRARDGSLSRRLFIRMRRIIGFLFIAVTT